MISIFLAIQKKLLFIANDYAGKFFTYVAEVWGRYVPEHTCFKKQEFFSGTADNIFTEFYKCQFFRSRALQKFIIYYTIIIYYLLHQLFIAPF